jgi:hypothetical protein
MTRASLGCLLLPPLILGALVFSETHAKRTLFRSAPNLQDANRELQRPEEASSRSSAREWLSQYRGMVDNWMLKNSPKFKRERIRNVKPRPSRMDLMAQETSATENSNKIAINNNNKQQVMPEQDVVAGDKSRFPSSSMSFISSLLGTFLPVFDDAESATSVSPPPLTPTIANVRPSASYAKVRKNGVSSQNLRHRGPAAVNGPFFVQREPLQRKRITPTPPAKAGIPLAATERNAGAVAEHNLVHSGYAQVNKHSKNDQDGFLQRYPSPEKVAAADNGDMRHEHGKKVRQKTSDPGAFCAEAIKLTNAELTKSPARKSAESRDEMYRKLWTLVSFFRIPIVKQNDADLAKRQMILLLETICSDQEDEAAFVESERNEISRVQSQNDDEILEMDSLSSPRPTPAPRRRPSLEDTSTRRSDQPSEVRLQQRRPFISARFDEGTNEIITARPNNPAKMSSKGENANFVVSGGFSFDSARNEVTTLRQQNGNPNLMKKGVVYDDNRSRGRPWSRPKTSDRRYFSTATRPPPLQGSYFPVNVKIKLNQFRMPNQKNFANRRRVTFPPRTESATRTGPGQRVPNNRATNLYDLARQNTSPSTSTLQSYTRDVRQTSSPASARIPPISTTIQPWRKYTDFDHLDAVTVPQGPPPAPPLPIMATTPIVPSSTKRNITMNDLHYVYNVTFYGDRKNSATADKASSLRQFYPVRETEKKDENLQQRLPQRSSVVKHSDQHLSSSVNEASSSNHYYPISASPRPKNEENSVRNLRPRFSPAREAAVINANHFPNSSPPGGRGRSPIRGQHLTEFHAPPDADMTYGTKMPNIGSPSRVPGGDLLNKKRIAHRDSLSSFFKAQSGKVPSMSKERLVIDLLNRNNAESNNDQANRINIERNNNGDEQRMTFSITTSTTTTTKSTTTFTTTTTTTTTTTQPPITVEYDITGSNEDEYYYVYEEYYDDDDESSGQEEDPESSKSQLTNEVNYDDFSLLPLSGQREPSSISQAAPVESVDASADSEDNSVNEKQHFLDEFANESAGKDRNNYVDVAIETNTQEQGAIEKDPDDHNKAQANDARDGDGDKAEVSDAKIFQNLPATTVTDNANDSQEQEERFYYKNDIFRGASSREEDIKIKSNGLDLVVDFETETTEEVNEVATDDNALDVEDLSERQPAFKSSIRNDRFAEDGLRSNAELGIAPPSHVREASSSSSSGLDEAINPEKLAYILIGVCCGLSILCLIVVAISIGYKSETHYRLEDGNRGQRHIRLLKASSNDGEATCTSDSCNGSTSETDSDRGSVDMSNMKLGPWFNGKLNIQTLDRKSTIAFPTSVYLTNLEGGTEREHSKNDMNSSDEDDNLEASAMPNTTTDNDNESLSSFDTIRTDPNLLRDPPHQNSRVRVLPDPAESQSKSRNFKKNSSYSIASNRFSSQGTLNLNKVGRASEGSVSAKAREKRSRNKTQVSYFIFIF